MESKNRLHSLKPNELANDVKWVDDYDVITRFHISKDTLDEWHKRGLPKYQLGKKTYYKESEVNAMIEKHRRPKDSNQQTY